MKLRQDIRLVSLVLPFAAQNAQRIRQLYNYTYIGIEKVHQISNDQDVVNAPSYLLRFQKQMKYQLIE